jgi:hypothetical protein
MNPYETYNKNKSRLDLRKYTKDFSLSKIKKGVLQEGKLYLMRYLPNISIPTDKHHILSVCFIFEKKEDEKKLVAVNLLYLKPYISLRLLQWWYEISMKEKRSKILEAWRMRFHTEIESSPYAFSLKTFEIDRILGIKEISFDEWGMIPLLRKEMLGITTLRGILRDYETEFSSRKKEKKKKAEHMPEFSAKYLTLADKLSEKEKEAMEFFIDLNSDEDEGKLML